MKQAVLVVGLLAVVLLGGLVARQPLSDYEVAPPDAKPTISRAPFTPTDPQRRGVEQEAQHQGQQLEVPLTDAQRERPPGDRPAVPRR